MSEATSARAAQILWAGGLDARILEDGIQGWTSSGHALAVGAAP
jgi:rhodanese-related sulfurtransferase